MPGAGAESDVNPDRPNILSVFTDDQNCRTLSCYPDAGGAMKMLSDRALAPGAVQARMPLTTWPWTSVSRNSRP